MVSRRAFELPESFWTRFAATHWEREPGVFADLFAEPILTPDETFRALMAAFEGLGPTDPGDRPRCFIEGSEVTHGGLYALFLARPSDGSLEGYARRLQAALNGRGFGVVVNAFHVHARELWYRLRSFFRGLYAVIGLPAAKTDPVLFFGNYPVSPFGIHTDDASVFTFTVLESKRMLLWPNPYFASRGVPAPESRVLASHEPFVRDALEQRIGPRDFMYWPSSFWHLGISNGELTASLGVGVYFGSARQKLISPCLKLALQARGDKPIGPMHAMHDASLPAPLEELLRQVSEAVSSGALRRELQAEWLRRLTSDGCLPAPPLRPISLSPKERVRLGRGGPILCVSLADERLIAANGHTFFLRPAHGPFDAESSAGLDAVLNELNGGRWARVGQLVKKAGPIGSMVQPLVQALAAADALERG